MLSKRKKNGIHPPRIYLILSLFPPIPPLHTSNKNDIPPTAARLSQTIKIYHHPCHTKYTLLVLFFFSLLLLGIALSLALDFCPSPCATICCLYL